MADKLFFEDVAVGDAVPELTKQPTPRQLTRYAGASHDFAEIHYNDPIAREHGFPGIIVHGCLRDAFLAQMITQWIGLEGTIKELNAYYRRIDRPGDTLTCKGKVVDKRVEDGQSCLELELWVENQNGVPTTTGKAVVALPSRAVA